MAASTYFELPGVAVVTWDEKSNAVLFEVQGWSNSTEIAAAIDAGLRALTEHPGSQWLVDGRNMKAIKQSDQDFLAGSAVPRAQAAGLRRIAIVIPARGLAMMNVADIMRRVPDAAIETRYFATVEEAKDWLAAAPTTTPNNSEAHSNPRRGL